MLSLWPVPTFSTMQATFTITEDQFNSLAQARRAAVTFTDSDTFKHILIKTISLSTQLTFITPMTGVGYSASCTLDISTHTVSGLLTKTDFSQLYQAQDSKLTSIGNLPNNQTGVIKITNGVASLEESLSGLLIDLGTLTFVNNVATFTVTASQYSQLHAADTAAIKFTTDGDSYVLQKSGQGSD